MINRNRKDRGSWPTPFVLLFLNHCFATHLLQYFVCSCGQYGFIELSTACNTLRGEDGCGNHLLLILYHKSAAMSINGSVKDYKNKTIICKLIHDDYLISIKKNQDTRVCPRWISVALNGSHYCRRW